MSSDTSAITVLVRPSPTWQLWRVRNTMAGGANDYVTTRSFALAALIELNRGLVLRARHTGDPVTDAFPNVGDEWLQESWFKEHTDTYVRQVSFLLRANVQPGDRWPDDSAFDYARRADESPRAYQDRLAADLHFVILSVEVTEPAILAHVPETFSTTAFDWWWKDPSREPAPAFLSVSDYESGIDEYVREGLEFYAKQS